MCVVERAGTKVASGAGRGRRGQFSFQVVGFSCPGEHDAQVKTIAAVQPLFARHPDTYARGQPRLPKGVSSTSSARECLFVVEKLTLRRRTEHRSGPSMTRKGSV